jgi:hypothetical protein
MVIFDIQNSTTDSPKPNTAVVAALYEISSFHFSFFEACFFASIFLSSKGDKGFRLGLGP